MEKRASERERERERGGEKERETSDKAGMLSLFIVFFWNSFTNLIDTNMDETVNQFPRQ